MWVDCQGRETPLPALPRAYVYPRLSPYGGRLALHISDKELDVSAVGPVATDADARHVVTGCSIIIPSGHQMAVS